MNHGRKRQSSATVTNLWHSAVVDANVDILHSHSYSCRMADSEDDGNTIPIQRAPSKGEPGGFDGSRAVKVGSIPSQYFQGARMALRQSVYHSSCCQLLKQGNGDAALTMAHARMASYHQKVFLDLVDASTKQSGSGSKDWRHRPFDHHLHRQYALGKHNPEDNDVATFQMPPTDPTTYGTCILRNQSCLIPFCRLGRMEPAVSRPATLVWRRS
jgi:hypothetical protein